MKMWGSPGGVWDPRDRVCNPQLGSPHHHTNHSLPFVGLMAWLGCLRLGEGAAVLKSLG